jgi:hypothetical protein
MPVIPCERWDYPDWNEENGHGDLVSEWNFEEKVYCQRAKFEGKEGSNKS